MWEEVEEDIELNTPITTGAMCFLKNTKISMGDDSIKNIENIIVGDLVKAFDTDKNKVINSKVTEVFIHPNATEYYIINNNIEWAVADVKLTRGNQSFSNSFSEKTSAEEIFINDVVDPQLKQHCILELNCGNQDGDNIIDTTGGGNKSIIFGEYRIKKTTKAI